MRMPGFTAEASLEIPIGHVHVRAWQGGVYLAVDDDAELSPGDERTGSGGDGSVGGGGGGGGGGKEGWEHDVPPDHDDDGTNDVKESKQDSGQPVKGGPFASKGDPLGPKKLPFGSKNCVPRKGPCINGKRFVVTTKCETKEIAC